jgi:hypothetical protein
MNEIVATHTTGLDLIAVDASDQRSFSIRSFSRTAKVADLVKALIPKMGLSTRDSAGRPLNYQAFSKRSGMHLLGHDTVGDALQSGDEISILPDIQAG